jgi:hypothetical protein
VGTDWLPYICGMNNEIKYIPAKEAIIGYSDSSIAKTESNDCVVRAIASAFEMHYDESHKLVAKIWFRRNREGTRNFTGGMRHMVDNKIPINGKSFSNLGGQYGNMKYDVKVKGQIVKRNMTTGTFIKKYPVGKYLVVVRGHAFSIIDGQVVGNASDATMKKRVINFAWKVS